MAAPSSLSNLACAEPLLPLRVQGANVSASAGTILVVDDNYINQMLLTDLLQSQGYTVITASNGRLALEVVASRPVDAVLLDLIMPELDGFDVLARLKGDPDSAHIPVIVISALDEIESVLRCIEMGAADHLAKPVDAVFLRARLNASLAAKHLRDQEQEYLGEVARLTHAAGEVQNGTFDPASLRSVCARSDELGKLARVFNHMVEEVRARELHLEEQNRVKSAFIGRMTHELRSPFVAAGFTVELMRRYAAHGMHEQLAEQIERLVNDLADGRRLIDGMINFASLVSRQIELNCTLVNPEHVIREATAHLDTLAEARGVSLSYDLAADLPEMTLDAYYLGEAVSQLVHNALKFSPQGGRVLVTAWLSDSDYLTVKVSDNGCGIAPAQLDLIWEAFGQTADNERRGVEGLGLGLALVKQVVTLHGGEVIVMSKPDQGSTFGFRIPVRVAAMALPELSAVMAL
jgi:signal transduction histidine kinase